MGYTDEELLKLDPELAKVEELKVAHKASLVNCSF
jgi:hypothetical protein